MRQAAAIPLKNVCRECWAQRTHYALYEDVQAKQAILSDADKEADVTSSSPAIMFLIPTFCRTDFLTVETQKFTVIIFAKISWCEVFDYTINSTNKRKSSNKSSAWNVIIIHFFYSYYLLRSSFRPTLTPLLIMSKICVLCYPAASSQQVKRPFEA